MLLENDSFNLEAISRADWQRLQNVSQTVDTEFKLS